MSQSSADRMIQEYLDDVSDRLSDLPASDRDEILAELRVHIEEAVGSGTGASETEVRNALDRLGSPEELAAEARLRAGLSASQASTEPIERRLDKTPTTLEVAAIILTAILWPIGVMLAWTSPRWLKRDKVIATALPAAGTLAVIALVVGGLMAWESGSSGAVSVSQSTTVEENQPATEPGVDERSPRTISETNESDAPWVRLVVVFGFLLGAIASPFVAATLLAIRLEPVEVRVYPDGRQFRDRIPAGKPA